LVNISDELFYVLCVCECISQETTLRKTEVKCPPVEEEGGVMAALERGEGGKQLAQSFRTRTRYSASPVLPEPLHVRE
jgi:hypothetical protein